MKAAINKLGTKIFALILIALASMATSSCYDDESVESPVKQQTPSDHWDLHIKGCWLAGCTACHRHDKPPPDLIFRV